MRRLFLLLFSSLLYSAVSAQSITPEQYISMYKDIAIREMKRMGVPASITLAQGLLETESGNGALVKKSNNHFGIKCKSSWSGGSVSHDDDANGECFRKYSCAEDSYRDHSNFLRGSERYAPLFKIDPKDYKAWAYGLKKAGYATNPAYPQMLIKSIEDYNLQQYTLMGINEVPVFDGSKYESDKEPPASNAIEVKNEDVNMATDAVMDISEKKMFNGVKAVYAAKGTSILAIATAHHIDLVKLLDYNDMKEDGLLNEGGWIFLEKKLEKGKTDFYIATKEETINNISQETAVQLSSLLSYNEMKDGEKIKQGTKIFLKPNVVSENVILASEPKIYVVQPKEGLYAISRKFNVSVQDLRAWNNLTSDDLKIGQKLIISK